MVTVVPPWLETGRKIAAIGKNKLNLKKINLRLRETAGQFTARCIWT
jgi:hypothetical protein